ncbi:MAG: hypothetical protein PHD09_00060 [Candidatus Omnitrophica bacterium]|jgi:hypothetical protein|nr:hypothetical protein [Candidatus Omnitrophota bacterium]
MNKKQLFFVSLLILLNMVAHFLPLERASFSSDDYFYLAQSKNVEIEQIPKIMFKVPDRPIIYSFFMLQGKLIGENVALGFISLVISSTLLLICIYWLFLLLLGNEMSAFFASLFYILLPNKLEIYHTLIFLNINIVVSIYILSLIAFIYFLKNQRKLFLFSAIFGYTIGIFWYEAGFFLPVAAFFYCIFYERNKTRYSFYYLIPVILYTFYRFTNSFGSSQLRMSGYNLDLAILPIRPLIDVFNHYFGRYLARSMIYGIYKFFTISPSWLIPIIFIDVFVLFTIIRMMVSYPGAVKRNKSNLYALILFIIFILPFLMNKNFGIASRYLIMPSIGVSIILVNIFEKMRNKWLVPSICIIFLCLLVSQGNSWAQVVSCRINAAIFGVIKENRETIKNKEVVIVDVNSLAKNIPHSLFGNQSNLFETYYGANMFHYEGIKGMVFLATENKNIEVYLASESPKKFADTLAFAIPQIVEYRKINNISMTQPINNVFIINYKLISESRLLKGITK